IVICDGGEDDTARIAGAMKVPVIAHPINLGAGAAIQTGLKYAVARDYDMAIVVDGDGQHDPNEVSKLIAAMDEKAADVVIGSRFLSRRRVRTHWARRIGIRFFSVIVSVVGRCKITDVTSGFRVFNKRAIGLLSREIPADFPDADLLLFLALSKYKIEEVPVDSRERQGGESMYSLLRSIYYPFKLIVALMAVMLRVTAEKRGIK
ncbi:MAG: glycosyltransferase family 2 protein, partial [Candidatus Margulisbacteria bacterium]|nr:glycosyltransferase family 2 protein [Candidatus Margulisiibacteriota bacterium]